MEKWNNNMDDPIISLEISIYPLGEPQIGPIIRDFVRVMESFDLDVQTTSMSSIVTGSTPILFAAMQKAFETVAKHNRIVMISKISNTCPV